MDFTKVTRCTQSFRYFFLLSSVPFLLLTSRHCNTILHCVEILREYGLDTHGIIFGHQKGDVHENVISNVMKGMSPLELAGMGESTVANGVVIWRPLLQHLKAEIYDFAHEWGIPYLKDSTPLWSTRGKIRNRLMPLLAEIYGEGYSSTSCAT